MLALTQIAEHARRTPGRTALVHDGVGLDYAGFARCIAATRQHLTAQQLRPDGVAIIASTHLRDAWVLLFALRSLGFTTVAAHTMEDIASLDLRHIACVVVSSVGDRQAAVGAPAGFPWRWVHVPRSALDAVAPLPDTFMPLVAAPAAGHILRTSGTTGVHKKLLRDVATEARGILPLAQVYGVSADSVVYVADFRLWTALGYRWPLIVWAQGGTVVMQTPPDLMRPFSEHDFSHVVMTPDKLMGMLRPPGPRPHPGPAPRHNPALRLMVTGGALSQALLADAQRVLAPQVLAYLATTEASIISLTPLHAPQDLLWHSIHPSREVQVVDDDNAPLAPGLQGRLRVRISDGLSGYLDDEAATRTSFRDGWFYPGDLAVFGADGRLSLRGRDSDVINVLGAKIAVASIEQALCDRLHRHADVTAVCILTVQGVAIDEELHLFIETAGPLTRAQIVAAVEAEFGLLRALPLRVHCVPSLPRNAMGKVLRVVLRQRLS